MGWGSFQQTNINLINNDIENFVVNRINSTANLLLLLRGKLGVIIGTFEHKLEQIKLNKSDKRFQQQYNVW